MDDERMCRCGHSESEHGVCHAGCLYYVCDECQTFCSCTKFERVVSADVFEAVKAENDKLRGLLAKGKDDCIYCGLPAEDIAKCASGFPGCGRMDDIMAVEEHEKEA